MFIYYFVPVAGRPFPEVEGALLDAVAELGVATGTPTRGLHETAIPLTWAAEDAHAPFSGIDADLVLSDLGPDLMHLAFRGTYPRSGPRARFDPVQRNRHRATELLVKRFLDRLAAEIDGRLPLRSSA